MYIVFIVLLILIGVHAPTSNTIANFLLVAWSGEKA